MLVDLPLDAVLRNGEVVRVREIGPDDRPLMRDGFQKLSDQSRSFRFLAPHPTLSKAELDRFTETNTDHHFAIGAASIGVEADMPLGTARFVRPSPGAQEAEIAITIIDSHQRLGLGRLLLDRLSKIAAARGVDRFLALLHPENTGMQSLLREFGGYRDTTTGAEGSWVLPLGAEPPFPNRVKAISIVR